MQVHGGGLITAHYLQGTGDAGFDNPIRVAECPPRVCGTIRDARARCDQADALVEEILDVARSAPRAKSSEEVQGYKLLVDTLKWRASKMKPRSYGEKLTLEAEVNVRQMTDEQLNARLTQLLER
jgi:hypothetical protein